MIPAGLGQIPPGRNSKLQGERLEQDSHEVREQNDAQQRIAEACASREISRPVAGVHVSDRHHVAGTGERERLTPERNPPGYRDCVVRLGKARKGSGVAPGGEITHPASGNGAHASSTGVHWSTCPNSRPITCCAPATSMVTSSSKGCRSRTVTRAPGRKP